MDSTAGIPLVNLASLSDSCRLQAAFLVMESLPSYYRAEGIGAAKMAAGIAQMIGFPKSEMENGFAALDNGEAVGILTFLPGASLPAARLTGAQVLLRNLGPESGGRFREHLKQYDADFGPVSLDSIYLSRLAIAEKYYGTGLAGRMMAKFLAVGEVAGTKPGEFSLHVDRANSRATAFYRKHGFEVIASGTRYLTMFLNMNLN